MPKTHAQIQQEIAALQKEAEAMLRRERPAVVAQLKETIALYGITSSDLGTAASDGRRGSKAKAKPGRKAVRGVPKYVDQNGNSWGGVGPRPGWLRGRWHKDASWPTF